MTAPTDVAVANGPEEKVGLLTDAAPGEVGFVRREGHLFVAFPKAYSDSLGELVGDHDTFMQHVGLLARILHRYRDDLARVEGVEYGTTGREAAEISDHGGLLDLVDAAAELRADYQRSGLFYVKSVRAGTDPSSPIEWPRTVREAPALISDTDVLYVDTIHRNRKRDPLDFFHRLHARTVAEVGRFFGDAAVIPDDAQLDDDTFAKVRAAPEGYLGPIRDRMYRERGRRLVDLITQFLNASARSAAADAQGETSLCRTDEFEFVWEHMVRAIFENEEGEGIATLASGRWLDARSNAESRGIRPRVDVVRAVAADELTYRYVCTIDAKDKLVAGLDARSGSEADHYKQLVYAQLLRGHASERFINALAFPFLTLDLAETRFAQILGSHLWDAIPGSTVFELALNFPQVCEAFLYERAIDAEAVVETLLRADAARDA